MGSIEKIKWGASLLTKRKAILGEEKGLIVRRLLSSTMLPSAL
jgi:hypothetical protein